MIFTLVWYYVKLLQLVQCSYPVILLFCCELWRHFMSFSSKVIIHWKGQLCPFRVAWQRNQRRATRAILSLACLWHIDLNVLPSHVTTIVWSWCAWPRYKCYIIDFQLPFPTCCGVRFRRYWNVVCACHSSAASSFVGHGIAVLESRYNHSFVVTCGHPLIFPELLESGSTVQCVMDARVLWKVTHCWKLIKIMIMFKLHTISVRDIKSFLAYTFAPTDDLLQ